MNYIQVLKDTAFAPPANSAPLDNDDLVWFNDLKNQFKILEPGVPNTDSVKFRAKQIINDVTAKPTANLNGQDLADLETWLIELLPLEDLKQKVPSLRDDYRDTIGDDAWNKILPTLTNQVATADEKSLRAEARRLQQDLHWRASIQPEAQRIRVMLMVRVVGVFASVAAFVLLMIWLNIATLGGVIVIAGTLGALISCIQRIQVADLCSSRATSMAKSDRLTLGVVISPLLGAVFALLLVLLLLAKQVTPGFVIPDVTITSSTNSINSTPTNISIGGPKPPSPSNQIATPTTNLGKAVLIESGNPTSVETQPLSTGKSSNMGGFNHELFSLRLYFATGKDLVLLILWAFVAGFSERLVPDLLTRIAETKKS